MRSTITMEPKDDTSGKSTSVKELRGWLSAFGEQNRQHFVKNHVQLHSKASNIRHKIQSFETAATTHSMDSFSAEAPSDERSDSTSTSALLERVDSSSSLSSHELENYRVVAIRKFPEPPSKNSCISFEEDFDFDNFSDPWGKPPCHPQAQGQYNQDESSKFNTVKKDDKALETTSSNNGRYTDPRKSFSRISKRRQEDSAVISDKKANDNLMCKKLPRPLVLFKSVKGGNCEVEGINNLTLTDFATTSSGDPILSPARHHFEEYPVDLFSSHTDYHRSCLEDGTGSTLSEDSGSPSIVPGAIDCRLNHLFAEEMAFLNRPVLVAATQAEGRQEDPSKRFDLADRELEETTSNVPGAIDCRLIHVFAEGTNILNRQKLLAAQAQGRQEGPPKREETAITKDAKMAVRADIVRKFGGMTKRSSVQRRKEELEKKWEKNRPPSHVKKTKWQVSAGTYKKKVVLDFTTNKK